jgi:hypothetical protein
MAEKARSKPPHPDPPLHSLHFEESRTEGAPVRSKGRAMAKKQGYVRRDKALQHWMYRQPSTYSAQAEKGTSTQTIPWNKTISMGFMRGSTLSATEKLQIWKLRTNTFPTQAWLYKVGKVETDKCQFCGGVTRETTTHFQSMCPKWDGMRRIKHNALLKEVADAIKKARENKGKDLFVDQAFPSELLDTSTHPNRPATIVTGDPTDPSKNPKAIRPDLVLRGSARVGIQIADVKVPSETSVGTTTREGTTHYKWLMDTLREEQKWSEEEASFHILAITCTGFITDPLLLALEALGLTKYDTRKLGAQLHRTAVKFQLEQIKGRWEEE